MGLRAPPEDRRDQGVAGGRLFLQRQQELQAQHGRFEFVRMHRRQVDAGKKFRSSDFHPFRSVLSIFGLVSVHRGIIHHFSPFDTPEMA